MALLPWTLWSPPAPADRSSVSGGTANTASGDGASVSGGGGLHKVQGNNAKGEFSTVSGGLNITATGEAEHAP